MVVYRRCEKPNEDVDSRTLCIITLSELRANRGRAISQGALS